MRRVQPIYADTFAKRRRWAIAGGALVIVVAIIVGALYMMLRNPRPSVHRYPVLGVQLTQSDGTQNFDALHKAGVSFVYLKATQGSSYFDDDFNTNYGAATSSSVDVGVYHYFSFDSDPDAQAASFIRQVGSNTGTLPIGIYITAYTELPQRAVLQQHLREFIRVLTAHYAGRRVVIMGSPTVLAAVRGVAKMMPRMVLSTQHRDVDNNAFWEYAQDAPIPGGTGTKYTTIVYNGTRTRYTELLR